MSLSEAAALAACMAHLGCAIILPLNGSRWRRKGSALIPMFLRHSHRLPAMALDSLCAQGQHCYVC